jgi:hypothetical protein
MAVVAGRAAGEAMARHVGMGSSLVDVQVEQVAWAGGFGAAIGRSELASR